MKEKEGKSRVHFRRRILIIFLVLGVPPLVVGHLLLVFEASQNYWEVIGTHLSQRADASQTHLINYLGRVSVQLSNLTTIPEIQTTVRQSNQEQLSQEELDRSIQEIEAQWQAMDPEKSKFLRDLLENTGSHFLREYNHVSTAFREILVTDVHGRLVAASNKSSDYFQGEERWWLYAFLEGQGNRYISDLQFDESANVYGIEVAQPIRDPSTQEVIGIIKAIVDSHELFGLIEEIQVGHNGQAVLLNSDAKVIFSPKNTTGYEFFEDFQIASADQSSIEALEVRSLPERRNRVLLGLPRFRFQEKLPELDWYVVVQAPYEEVSAPFSNVNTWFFYIVLFAVSVVVVLSLVFSHLLSKPVIETDPHLERL